MARWVGYEPEEMGGRGEAPALRLCSEVLGGMKGLQK